MGARSVVAVVAVVGALALTGAGCAHTDEGEQGSASAPPGPPLETQIEVSDLKLEERTVLEKSVCALPKVESCTLTVVEPEPEPPLKKSKKRRRKKKKAAEPEITIEDPLAKKRVMLRFTYTGTLPELHAALAGLPHPALVAESSAVKLMFIGSDNIPPPLKVMAPEDGSAHTTKEIGVLVEVTAVDVAEVKVNGEAAESMAPGVYRSTLNLEDGEHKIRATAADQDGNEAAAELSILVDTTPPTLKVKVIKQAGDRVVLSGEVEGAAKVTVDGLEVPIINGGNFSKNLPADPDKKQAEVVATDEHGNATTVTPQLDNGWEGAAGPGT